MKTLSAISISVPRPVRGKKVSGWWLALMLTLVGVITSLADIRSTLDAGHFTGLPLIMQGVASSPTPLPEIDPTPPSQPVKLIFIQPSYNNWLTNVNGGLGAALRDNNYFVSSTNETWGPDKIGGRTDIGNWWEWFRGPDSETYLASLFAESGKNLIGTGNYSRLPTDPGGENTIVVFESLNLNSALGGTLTETIPAIGQNRLRGQSLYSEFHTLANAKGIYQDLLRCFQQHPDKLFVVVTAGPLTREDSNPTEAANARALNTWLVNEWLKDYPYSNVGVFDLFNVLTSFANHHHFIRTYKGGKIEYITSEGGNYLAYNYLNVTLRYPDRPGNLKAVDEFVPLLNVYYNRWRRADSALPSPTPVSGTVSVGQWSTPTQFPNFGWFPDIAVDNQSQVHVVWSSSTMRSDIGYDVVLHSVSTDGKQWSPASDIAALPQEVLGNAEVTRPALLSDPRGVLHMTFRAPFAHYTQAPVAQAGLAVGWRPLEQLNQANWAYFSRLALDRQGRLHLVYTENYVTSSCVICYHLYYRRSDDGQTWTPPVDISQLPTGAAKPQILIDDQNDIHVVWEVGRGGTLGHVVEPAKVAYVASHNGGETWTQPLSFASPRTGAKDSLRNIVIGQDGQGNLVVAWLSVTEDRIYFQVSADHGSTWSAPELVPEVWGAMAVYPSELDDYAMATDSAGILHLLMVGRTYKQQSLSVLHLTWNGSVWSMPEQVATFRGDVPEWPRLAIGDGNRLHAVWFVRNEADIWAGGGDYRIWYSQSLASAPVATPSVWPTATPTSFKAAAVKTPTPYVTVPVTPNTPLPVATATFLPASRVTPSYSEQDYLVIIAQAILPVLLILGLIIAVISIFYYRSR